MKTNRTKLVALSVLAGALGALSLAAVPNVFVAGDTISAEQMNANFAALEEQIAALERASVLTVGDGQYSLGAVFVRTSARQVGDLDLSGEGSSFDSDGKSIGAFRFGGATGYEAGKDVCAALLESPTAHMCDGREMVRSRQMGLVPARSAWYSTGVASFDTGADGGLMRYRRDCRGWENSGETGSEQELGGLWYVHDSSSKGVPDVGFCQNAYPIACCD